jgi:hypothetical protein
MTERDPRITAVLDRLVPDSVEPRDWQQLLATAGAARDPAHLPFSRPLPARRRLLLALVLLLLAVLIPLTALAIGNGWWFLSAYGPKPVGNVVIVTSGRWQGMPWNLTAFRTDKGTICYAVTVRPATPQLLGSTEACGPVSSNRPISFLRSLGVAHLELSRGRFTSREPQPHPFPAYIVGAVIKSALEVDAAAAPGTTQRIPTVAAPAGLHAAVRFFIAARPAGENVRGLTARDEHGNTVAHTIVESPPTSYHLASAGKQLPLTQAAIHVLRLHHRSPHIYLLASRAGRNLYRLGTSGRCYGTGRADHLSWTPPDNVMRILGIVECGGKKRTGLELGAPVLDLSVYRQNRGQKLMTVYTLAGIASSAVVAVELVNANGVSIRRVPVHDSVYADRPLPHGVVAIAPENAAGVWLSTCGYGKNSLPILLMRC